MRPYLDKLDEFFFRAHYGRRMGLFRLIFLSALFLDQLSRLRSFSLFFSDQGIFAFSEILELKLPGYGFPVYGMLEILKDGTTAYLLNVLYVVLIFVSAIGLLGRSVGWILVLLHVLFFYRTPGIIDGSDYVTSFWLFYLAWADTTGEWSIWSYLRNRKSREKPEEAVQVPPRNDFMTSAAFRMLQIQLCTIYGYTGLEKVRGMSWWRGDAVWNANANSQMVMFDLGFMRHLPEISIFMGFLTVVWEVYFPALIWNRKLRPWMLGLGLCFHGSIAVIFGLPDFSIFMLSSYVLFLDEAT